MFMNRKRVKGSVPREWCETCRQVTTQLERGCLRCLGRADHRKHAVLSLALAVVPALCAAWLIYVLPLAAGQSPEAWASVLAGLMLLGYATTALVVRGLNVLVHDRFCEDEGAMPARHRYGQHDGWC